MWFVGMLFGILVGSIFGGDGAVLGAVLGIIGTVIFKQWKQLDDAEKIDHADELGPSSQDANDTLNDPALAQRIAALETQVVHLNARIKQLESHLHLQPPASAPAETRPAAPSTDFSSRVPLDDALQTYRNAHTEPDVADPEVTATASAVELAATAQAMDEVRVQPLDTAEDGSLSATPIPTELADVTPHTATRALRVAQPATQWASDTEADSQPAPVNQDGPASPDGDIAPAAPSFWAKLLGGNILAKIGVLILFFAVGSALKLAVAHGLFPIEVRLLLGAVGAVGMTLFGWSRAQTEQHRMFGVVMQGGGFGILYLLVYFMLTRYGMLSQTWAFIGFTLLGISCTLLAAKQDSLWLAAYGISGAFLSPVLAANDGGSHIVLFSYFALLNVFVFALNWFKGWRQMNIIGFLFTLGIGMSWALQSYQPAYLASTEFFLLLFFLLYSLEPVCFALFRQATAMQWGDGLLLFGTPTVAVASQAVLMQPFQYGQAWSVFVMGLYYLALWGLLYRKQDETLKLSERCHLGIGLTLLTYAVPLAFGAQITSAIWTVEGAAVLWLGLRQDRYLARWTGMALQVLAGGYFIEHLDQLAHAHAIFNDVYIGSCIVAVSGMVSGLMLHRWEKKTEQLSADGMLAWGMLWFMVASSLEIDRFVLADYQNSAWLAYFAALTLGMAFGGQRWEWPLLRNITLLTLALGLIAYQSIVQHQHVLTGALTLVYPTAVALQYWLLARQERDGFNQMVTRAVLFWGLSVLVSNEVGWAIQHYLAPERALWYWLPFSLTLSGIALWRGIRQEEQLARLLGMALQMGISVYLLAGYGELSQPPAIYNDFFLGGILLALAAWVAAGTLHRKSPQEWEGNVQFYLGLIWLIDTVCLEIFHFTEAQYQDAAWLSFFAILVAVLEVIGKRENWGTLRQLIALAFMAIFAIAADATFREHHVLYGMLIPVFPAALALYYWQLARHERDQFNVGLPALHLGMFWGVAALFSHEISWMIQRMTPGNPLWHLLAYGISLALITLGTLKAQAKQIFPTNTTHANYAAQGLIPVVLANMVWFAIANVHYSGDGSGLPYIPVLNPLDLVMLLSLFSIRQWSRTSQPADTQRALRYALPVAAFLWVSTLAARLAHNWAGVPFDWDILAHNPTLHALLSVIWTLVSITLMIYASRQAERKLWFTGFGLLAVVGAKLMLVDLRNSGTVVWTASLFGIAVLVIAASYFSPAPPKVKGKE